MLPLAHSMLPLAHRRILITRPREQASTLAAQLQRLGATTILIPTIEIAPPASFCALDAALTTLRAFDWVVFTSANAVRAFARRARTLNLPAHPRRVAVIGPATAAAVQGSAITPDDPTLLMPSTYIAESLAQSLLPYAPGAQMLLPRAAAARDILPETLANAGATVMLAEAYRTVIPRESIDHLTLLFTTAPPEAILFTSASTAQNLAALLAAAHLSVPSEVTLASIGPITSQAMREANLTPGLEARESTIPSLIEALQTHFQSSVRSA